MAEPPRTTRNRGVWWVVGILLLIPIVMPLLVPLYARNDPELGGMPFFFWYQFMWVFLAAGLTWVAYVITTRQERKDRAARRDRENRAAGQGGASQ
jgi:thiosulfate reductase cytochrome b subunit